MATRKNTKAVKAKPAKTARKPVTVLKPDGTRISPHKHELALLKQHVTLHGEKYVVFDLDGCISDHDWRVGYIDDTKGVTGDKKFDTYHSYLSGDSELQAGAAILRDFIEAGITPIFITARPEKWRIDTVEWLSAYFGLNLKAKRAGNRTAFLLMRKNNDKRETVELKLAAMNDVIKITDAVFTGRNAIVAAFDDLSEICETYANKTIRPSGKEINAYQLDERGIVASYEYCSEVHPIVAKHLRPKTNGELNTNYTSADDVDADFPLPMSEGDDTCGKETPAIHHEAVEAHIAAGTRLNERLRKFGASDERAALVMEVLFPNGLVVQGMDELRVAGLMASLAAHLTRFVDSGMKSDDIREVSVIASLIAPYREYIDPGVLAEPRAV